MLKAKFKVGQKVYAVTSQSDTREKQVECTVCDSTGRIKIEGKDGQFTWRDNNQADWQFVLSFNIVNK